MTLPFILAIDTSCDETSVAITQGNTIYANVVASQVQLHKQYGGVFPTVAKQAHLEQLEPTVKAALRQAQLTPSQLGLLAVTLGPGLAPALEVGIRYAEHLSQEWQLPLIPINHIEGHVVSVLAQPLPRQGSTPRHDQPPHYPVLSVIISGKHCDYIAVTGPGQYQRLGWTVDDAAGEVLDKVGRMIDLGYPAGPILEEWARRGDPKRFPFPLPMTTSGDFNLSFSGMKTAARNFLEQQQALTTFSQQDIYNFCASFQFAVFKAIGYKLNKILQTNSQWSEVWLGGGVAANRALRDQLRAVIKPYGLQLKVPYNKRLCGDNAAMIGVAAQFHLDRLPLDSPLDRRPQWKVDEHIQS